MSCCVPNCASVHTLVDFPANNRLRQRWLKAINAGVVASASVGDRPDIQICVAHFAKPGRSQKYREPTRFVDGNGQQISLTSCRLCLRFYPERETFPAMSQMPNGSFPSILRDALKIPLKPGDFLKRVCRECVVSVDVASSLQNAFSSKNLRYENLRKIAAPLEVEDSTEKKDEAEPTEDHKPPVEQHEMDFEVELEENEQSSDHESDDDQKPEFFLEVEMKSSFEIKTETSSKRVKKKVLKKPGRPKKHLFPMRPRNSVPMRVIMNRKCYICESMFDDAGALELHLLQNHVSKDGQHTCEECDDGKVFHRVFQFNKHLSFHDPTRPLKCNFCPLRYCTIYSRNSHENNVHGTDHKDIYKACPQTNVQCDECGKVFTSSVNVNAHKRIAHGMITEKFDCKICGKSFHTPYNLGAHMETHSDLRPHKCDICARVYKGQRELKQHVLSVHEGKVAYRCLPCKLEFVAKRDYVHHKSQIHRNNRQYFFTCRLCKEIPQSREELEGHIAKHHSDTPYPYRVCKQCGHRSLTSQDASIHARQNHQGRTDTGEPIPNFVCDVCGKSYFAKTTLKTHIETVHMGKPNPYQVYLKPAECNLCGKSFQTKQNMARHQRTVHQRERPFQCDLCDMSFGQRSTMEDHRRNIHTLETPYLCKHCGMRFKEGPTYSKHRIRCEKQGEADAGDEGDQVDS